MSAQTPPVAIDDTSQEEMAVWEARGFRGRLIDGIRVKPGNFMIPAQ